MKNKERHLHWNKFKSLIDLGIPAIHRIEGVPTVDLFVDNSGKRIGLHTPGNFSGPLPANPLEEVNISLVKKEDGQYFEISTNNAPLFPEFYHLLLLISDNIQIGKKNPIDSFNDTINNWKHLVNRKSLLSPEAQIGLIGELWLLRRLIKVEGCEALNYWTGPLHEAHDFRFKEYEIEVKSTRGEHRIHVINGIDQLTPSPNHILFMLSLVFAQSNSASGISLVGIIRDIRLLLSDNLTAINKFDQILENNCSFNDSDSEFYDDGYHLRKPAMLIESQKCPQFGKNNLTIISAEALNRIIEVHYSINVEDLGYVEDSNEFKKVIS